MAIPTEPIGSIPRPPGLVAALANGNHEDPALDPLYEQAIRDTIEKFEATGSPVITDGEQRKYHNFWTYCVHGLANTDPDGFKIPFAAGHTRRMPRLTAGPFRYKRYADSYLDAAARFARSEDRTRALRAGFMVHVSKPVEPSELVATVASVSGRHDR